MTEEMLNNYAKVTMCFIADKSAETNNDEDVGSLAYREAIEELEDAVKLLSSQFDIDVVREVRESTTSNRLFKITGSIISNMTGEAIEDEDEPPDEEDDSDTAKAKAINEIIAEFQKFREFAKERGFKVTYYSNKDNSLNLVYNDGIPEVVLMKLYPEDAVKRHNNPWSARTNVEV